MAQILTSISGLPISAASAGFAPTIRADVSAIASGYQVVSATGTQLYAGTAHVTSLNSAPLSASRAGNAANASMANSAYYDGTGRLISSLPDSATVSSIASSYAESAASGKLDTTAQVVTATAGDGTYVTSINGMGLSGQGGGGGGGAFPADIVTAGTVRAVVTTGFQDNTATRPTLFISSNPSTTAYPRMLLSENHVGTGKSGAFLADAFEFYAGTGVKVFRADSTSVSGANFSLTKGLVNGLNWSLRSSYVTGGNNKTNWLLNKDCVSGASGTATWQYGTAEYNKLTSVHDTVSANSASWGGGATGDYVEKSALEVAIGSANSASATAFAQGGNNCAAVMSFAQGFFNGASATSFAQGERNSVTDYSFAQGYNNSASSISFAQGIGNTASGGSFVQGGGNSAINTAAVFGQYNLRGDGDMSTGNSAAFAIGDGTAWNARHDLMLVTKDGEITLYSSTADTTGTGIMSAIRAISAAATGGGGGVVTATGSASAVTGGWFPSYLVSSINGSALLPYGFSSVSANSANWNNARTAVTANSANWNSAYSLISGVTALMDSI